MSRLKMSAALPSSHPAETSSQTAIHTRATERAKKIVMFVLLHQYIGQLA